MQVRVPAGGQRAREETHTHATRAERHEGPTWPTLTGRTNRDARDRGLVTGPAGLCSPSAEKRRPRRFVPQDTFTVLGTLQGDQDGRTRDPSLPNSRTGHVDVTPSEQCAKLNPRVPKCASGVAGGGPGNSDDRGKGGVMVSDGDTSKRVGEYRGHQVPELALQDTPTGSLF